jgi:hypothetical protein
VAFVRYGVALILTILMLGIARRTSTRHPEDYSQSVGDLTASHRTVTEDFGGGPSLEIQVSDTDSLEAVVYYSIVEGGPYNTDTLDVSEAGFSVVLPVHDKGEKLFYHLKLYKKVQRSCARHYIDPAYILYVRHRIFRIPDGDLGR